MAHYYEWERSVFDSDILGVAAGKILAIQGKTSKTIDAHVRALVQDLKKHGIQYATYRLPAHEFMMIQCLEKNGFELVDGLITLKAPILDRDPVGSGSIVEASSQDHAQLSHIASTVFRGVSRYYHDPYIAPRKADAIYTQWIKNSLNGIAADTVLVSKEGEKVLGFITLQKKQGSADIPLIGVSPAARGKGIGKGLIQSAVAMCRRWGVGEISVATQVSNILALRLYQSSCFTIAESYFTLRWWHSE